MAIVFLLALLASLIITLYGYHEDNFYAFLSGIIMSSIFLFCSLIYAFTDDKPKSTTYECPCGVTEIVTDEVVHYNKSTGDTTITTYIDVSNCIKQSK